MDENTEAGIEPEIDAITGEVLSGADDTPDFDPDLDTLMGDMRDAMLQRIRTLKKPWAQMSEGEQYDCANGIELAAKDMIRKTVRLLNKFEWPHAVVELGEVKIGGTKGIEAKITCSNIALNRNVLGEHVGTQIMLLMVDSDTFMAERAPARVDKDQPDLPLDGAVGGDEPPPEPEGPAAPTFEPDPDLFPQEVAAA